MEIVDVVKLIGEGTAWFLTIWFAKGWFEAKVLEPLSDLKKDIGSVKTETKDATQQIKAAAFNVSQRTIDLQTNMSQEAQKMTNIFAQATQHATEAQYEARLATEKVKDLSIDTDQKLRNVGANLLGKIKVIESDVAKVKSDTEEIRKDVFFIKGKKDK